MWIILLLAIFSYISYEIIFAYINLESFLGNLPYMSLLADNKASCVSLND